MQQTQESGSNSAPQTTNQAKSGKEPSKHRQAKKRNIDVEGQKQKTHKGISPPEPPNVC